MANLQQIKIIHTLKSKLGWDDDMYRDILQNRYNVKSSKDLSIFQAETLIEEMKKAAGQPNYAKYRRSKGERFEDLGKRDEMATPNQLKMIEALWREVSRIGQDTMAHEDDFRKSLNSMTKRIAGVDCIEWLKKRAASKLIKALQTMKTTQKKEG